MANSISGSAAAMGEVEEEEEEEEEGAWRGTDAAGLADYHKISKPWWRWRRRHCEGGSLRRGHPAGACARSSLT
jgi:hypothetical protein